MAEVTVDVLKINTAPAEKSMGSLKQQLKDTKEQMMELRMRGAETSEEYKKLAQRAGELAKAMQRANEDIREASTTFSNTVKYVSGSLAGVSGAVQAATGALSLMGVEMGSDTKLMKTLVAAMSMTSGLTAIQASVEAFKKLTTNIKRSTLAQKGLNAAIKANPVGAIIAGVVALTAAVVAFTNSVNKAREAQAKLNAEANNKALLDSYNELETKLGNIVAMMEVDGATDTEIYEMKKKNAKSLRDIAEQNYLKNYEIMQNGTKAERKAAEEQYTYWKGEFEKRADAYQNLINQNSIVYYKAQKEQEKKAEEARKKSAQASAQAAEKEAKEIESQLAKISKINRDAELGLMGDRDAELAKLKDTYDEELALFEKRGADTTKLTEYYRKQEAEINKKYDDQEAERIKQGATDAYNTARLQAETEYHQKRTELIIKNEKDVDTKLAKLELAQIDREKELLKQQLDNNLITNEEYQNQLTQLEEEQADKRVQLTEEEAEKKKKIQESYMNAMQKISSSLGSILGSLADTVSEDTETYKNLKAAQAIIATLSAAVAAFAGITESTGGWGIAAAIAEAAAVVATGMAEVRKIYAVDTSGGKNSTSATSVNSGAVTTLGQNYNNTRLLDNGGGIYDLSRLESQGATKVYVTTHDITNTARKVEVTTRRNKF